jgi:hypothetical protein
MLNLKPVFTKVLIGAISLLALTSCSTQINLQINDQAVLLDVAFYGEAKDSILANPATDQQLLNLLAEYSNSPVERTTDKVSLHYLTKFPLDKTQGSVTSIKNVMITENGKLANINVIKPYKLDQAVKSALTNNQTKDVLIATYEKNIVFNLAYKTSNIITAVTDQKGKNYNFKKHEVSFTYNLSNVTEQSLTIQSKYDYTPFFLLPITLLLLIVLYKYYIKKR